MKLYELTLRAGVPMVITAPGNFVHALNAASPFVVKNYDSGERLYLVPGVGLSVSSSFSVLEITSEADQNIDLYVGFGSVVDSRSGMEAGASGSFVGFPDVTVEAGASGLVVPASGSRTSVIVTLSPDAPDYVRLGGPDVSDAGGVKLLPAGSLALESGSAIYAFNPNGVSVVLYGCEVA